MDFTVFSRRENMAAAHERPKMVRLAKNAPSTGRTRVQPFHPAGSSGLDDRMSSLEYRPSPGPVARGCQSRAIGPGSFVSEVGAPKLGAGIGGDFPSSR